MGRIWDLRSVCRERGLLIHSESLGPSLPAVPPAPEGRDRGYGRGASPGARFRTFTATSCSDPGRRRGDAPLSSAGAGTRNEDQRRAPPQHMEIRLEGGGVII